MTEEKLCAKLESRLLNVNYLYVVKQQQRAQIEKCALTLEDIGAVIEGALLR